ncbi:MAG: deoxyribonuclease IV [Candidatus Hydrogenedentota bacterium]
MKPPLFGFHESIAGGLYKAAESAQSKGLLTFQMFTRNPRGWNYTPLQKDEILRFKDSLKINNIKIAVAHMPYLPNLAGNNQEFYKKSVLSLKEELKRCALLGIPYLVTHLGSHLGAGYENGLKRILEAIEFAMKENKNNEVLILLENTAGTKNSMGTKIEEMQRIIEMSKYSSRLGICLDTSHAWGAGYKIDTETGVKNWLKEVDDKIGLDRLKVIHLNDSPVDLASNIDRHWHIGEGNIGDTCFRTIINMKKFEDIPKILETPVHKKGDDKKNQIKIQSLSSFI